MDLLIENKKGQFTLSSFGILVNDIMDSSPVSKASFRQVKHRNGRIFDGMTYSHKTISVIGKVTVDNWDDFEFLKDGLNALIFNSEPYFITKLITRDKELYGFERPGEKTGDLDLLNQYHQTVDYRWHIVPTSEIVWSFIGKSRKGILHEVSINFETVDMPYGESKPQDLLVSGGQVYYNGTAEISQFESPYTIKLTSTATQNSFFTFALGDSQLIYRSTETTPVNIALNDVFYLDGYQTLKNFKNVTHETDYNYFTLKPGTNEVLTDFIGTIEILNYKEFYK